MPEINKLTVKNDQGLDVTYDIRDSILESDVEEVKRSISEIESERKGMWAISRPEKDDDNTHYLLYSDDGINFRQVGSPIPNLGSDASAVCEIEGIFYYSGNNSYSFSTDMATWVNPIRIIQNPLGRVWASWLLYDKSSKIIYIYSSYEFRTGTGTDDYFKIVYQTATQNEDGTLSIDQTLHDLLYAEGQSWIDPSVVYDPIYGYVFAVKRNGSASFDPESYNNFIYKMTSPTSLGDFVFKFNGAGREAPQLVSDGQGNILCYMQNNNVHARTSVTTAAKSAYAVAEITNKYGWNTGKAALQTPVKALLPLRHMGLAYCTGKAYSCLKKIGISAGLLNKSYNIVDNGVCRYVNIADEGEYNIINHPDTIYVVGTGSSTRNYTFNPIPVFANEPFKLLISKSNITWGGEFLPDWYGVKTLNETSVNRYIEIPVMHNGPQVRPEYND